MKQTLAKIGVSRPTFHRCHDLYRRFSVAGLEDRRAGPKRPGWNCIPDDVRAEIVEMTLDKHTLSPRELVVTFTDERAYFVSEASVYRLLEARGLITSPTFVVMKPANQFKDKTTVLNQHRARGALPARPDGFHVSESDWVGLVLYVDDP